MSRQALQTAVVEELIALFVDFCIQQDRELERGDIPQVNRLFEEIESVEAELKRRPGDQRSALIPLYRHENMQVRLKAAEATLAVAPEAARRTLKEIQASKWQPQAADAGMSLWSLERGIFKPT